MENLTLIEIVALLTLGYMDLILTLRYQLIRTVKQ